MAEKENVITRTYDMLLYIMPLLEQFPKKYKYFLAEKIQSNILEIMEDLIEAYYTKGDSKKALLNKVNIHLEKLRYEVRLSKDLRCINVKRYELWQRKINEIGQQVGSWRKSLK